MADQDIIPAGKPMGRPLKMTREIEDIICRRLAMGESLIAICADDDMPCRSTVFDWMNDERCGDFVDRYARARETQADSLFDEIKEIADQPVEGEIVTEAEDGTTIKREDMLGHRRLQIDTRKWMAAKLRPKKYGEKLDITSDDKPLIPSDDVAAKAASLLAVAAKRRDEQA